MRIVELKPQNAKIIYKPANESIKVGEFISFTEGELTLVAQVYRVLSSDAADDFNQADMNFMMTQKYGKVNPWQGELVSAEAIVSKTPKNVIDAFTSQNNKNTPNFILGRSPFFDGQYETLCFENFATPAFIGYERHEDNINLTKNLCQNISALGKKSVILDFKGNLDIPNSKKVVAGVNTKLPLNQKMIEDLCPKMLEGVSLESKVVIEDILIELAQYAQESSEGFIPITNLINVIDDFYKKSKMTPLILLKNKLRHYERMNLFANNLQEACSIYKSLEENNTVVFDVSNIPISWQNEFFNNLIDSDSRYDKDFYLFITIDNLNFDNNILNYLLFKAESIGIKPIISANYRHLSFDSIYDFSQNMFLFKTYNTLKKRQVLSDILQTLPAGCFITTGKLSEGLILLENILPAKNGVGFSSETTPSGECIHNNQEPAYSHEGQIEQLEELTDYGEENHLQNIDMDMMNGALEPTPNTSIKEPADLMNNTINPTAVQTASEIVSENLPSQEIVGLIENELPQKEIPSKVQITETPIAPVEEPSFEKVIEIAQPLQTQTQDQQEQIINISMPETPAEETAPMQEPEIIIDESSFEEPNKEISDYDNQLEEAEILDLVEDNSEQAGNSDDELFEEVSGDDSLENIDLDDLDFLNENTPSQNTISDSDDELLDLMSDEQLQNGDDEFGLDDTPSEEPANIPQQQETLPVYDANYRQAEKKQKINLKEGDLVKHNKFGVGTITKITTHGDKVLCFINFDNLGRKLLDPELSQLEKID